MVNLHWYPSEVGKILDTCWVYLFFQRRGNWQTNKHKTKCCKKKLIINHMFCGDFNILLRFLWKLTTIFFCIIKYIFFNLQYYSVQIPITVLNPWNLEPALAKDVLNDKSSLVRRYSAPEVNIGIAHWPHDSFVWFQEFSWKNVWANQYLCHEI